MRTTATGDTRMTHGHVVDNLARMKRDERDGKPEQDRLAWRRRNWPGSHSRTTKEPKGRFVREWHKGPLIARNVGWIRVGCIWTPAEHPTATGNEQNRERRDGDGNRRSFSEKNRLSTLSGLKLTKWWRWAWTVCADAQRP
jgi:hypothetical protein